MEFLIILLIAGFICAGVGGYIAGEKNRNAWGWAIICFLLGIFGIIAIASVPTLPSSSLKRKSPQTKIYVSHPTLYHAGDTSFLVVDFKRKQIIVGIQETCESPHKKPYEDSFAFFDIVKAEIVRDGTQIMKTDCKNQDFNGAEHIAIRVNVKSSNNPVHEVIFYAARNIDGKQKDQILNQAVQKVMEFKGYLDSAIREGGKEQEEQIENKQSTDISEQLSRLWQLKQEGALTQEEFEAQKAKLLQS